MSDTEVVIVGAGAAGIAAGRRLHDAGIDCRLIEARARLGGRAWTVPDQSGFALDLGCGWLHSADRNPWREVAEAQGRTLDRTPPPWSRPAPPIGLSLAEQGDILAALRGLFERLGTVAEDGPDEAAAGLLAPGGRWNTLLNAVSTYINGAELERVSLRDFARYDDTGVNWRVTDGLGTTIAAHGAGLPAVLDCPVHRIDHSGKRIRVETAKGVIACDRVIVAAPSALLANEDIRFTPSLPEKVEAAGGLPLGLADKLFLSLDGAEEFEPDVRFFGRTDRVATGTYHFRPFGRPLIEVYFGGSHAAALEADGEAAAFDFARSELSGLLGADFVGRVKPIRMHRWGVDPFARGSYSYARPGAADRRGVLAAPLDDRLFFAGEACSRTGFSTAHGAFATGVAAAEQAMAARGRTPSHPIR